MAASLGLQASFLAKTEPGEEGSSGHVHLSCWADGANVFAASDGAADALPAPFAGAIAGILEHLPAASLMLNPTINSYKRLVPGWFAPVNVSWGLENRSCAVRAIRGEDPDRWRIECRRPGADANPYLALAALAASAADGIARDAGHAGGADRRRRLRAIGPATAAGLARECATRVRRGSEFRALLGEAFCDYYRVSREWELSAWREAVSDWERERYERAV